MTDQPKDHSVDDREVRIPRELAERVICALEAWVDEAPRSKAMESRDAVRLAFYEAVYKVAAS